MSNYHALLSKSHSFFAEQAGFEGHRPPPSWVMDRLAEEAFTGKYNVAQSNICPSCFTARPVTGECYCGAER